MEDSKRATVPKQGGSISAVKDAIAKDVDEVEGDLKSIYEYITRIVGFFVSLSKLCVLLVLEPVIVVSNMISDLEFDQILHYIGYTYLAVFVIIPLKIFVFFISMPYVITKKFCQTSIEWVHRINLHYTRKNKGEIGVREYWTRAERRYIVLRHDRRTRKNTLPILIMTFVSDHFPQLH